MSIADLIVGPWAARFMGRDLACSVGRGGIGEKRREGDGITPAGVHRIEDVWHRADRIRTNGNRTGLRDGWSDDPGDPDCNSHVLRPHPFSSEGLRRSDPLYDLIAVLDWNRHPVRRGLGSAIFLHVWRKPRHPTEGCIAFARADLEWILARWTASSRVRVRP